MTRIDYFQLIKLMDLELADELAGEDEYPYYDGELGIKYSREKSSFRIWAPLARSIKVLLFEEDWQDLEGEGKPEPYLIKEMQRDIKGTWYTEISGDLAGSYHIYQIQIGNKVNYVVDPYTRAVGTNSKLGLIVDLARTNPPGWEKDQRVKLAQPQDAVIYETHIRDFTSAADSGIFYKNKYLAFTEIGTVNKSGLNTGIGHLQELGITHLHLLPVFDFASVDDLAENEYNWGYDPYFFNVPEGSYSTDPVDESRIREFKEMVMALHTNGIGLIMDVVYNHTYYTASSPFNKIVPNYYYRRDDYGNFSDGSGTGNEIASEKPMVRKFIVDSVRYWAEEYHIDGFRFDLMALHDCKTMVEVERVLHGLDPSILIYGEPWTGGLTQLDPWNQMVKGRQQGLRIAVFNDHFRNAIKGDNDGRGRGFVSGGGQALNIKRGIVGGINYSEEIRDFTSEPWETINYVTSHDNLTLWDKLSRSNPEDSARTRNKMARLAQGIILTAQGIPFIYGGEELLRSKAGNPNSYNAGDEINQFKWERKTIYYNTFAYIRGLIRLRKEHPAFRLKNAGEIRRFLKFLPSPENTVAFYLGEYANNDPWRGIVVLFNPGRRKEVFSLPFPGQWQVVVDDNKAGTEPLYYINSAYVELAPISMMVLYQE